MDHFTPRKRVEAVLRHEQPDKTPLTMYECMIPQCTVERRLRNDGMCIVNRTGVYRTHTPNVRTERLTYTEDGVTYIRTTHRTPVGELFSIGRPAGFTTWQISKLFKGPDDYKILKYIVEDERYEPAYEDYARGEEAFGEDAIFRAAVGSNPLHHIMVQYMGAEAFAVEWAERRDEILNLYDAMAAKRREVYPIVAKSPALHANYGGNEVPEFMGLERFEKYVVPLYNEAAAVFHEHGKLLGTHLDGNNRLWAEAVAGSDLDYIEAFTPAPDTDMSVADALEAWPNKVLWINFPSSLHLFPASDIETATRDMIQEASPGNRFLIGITEDVPEDRWQQNMLAISRVVNRIGRGT